MRVSRAYFGGSFEARRPGASSLGIRVSVSDEEPAHPISATPQTFFCQERKVLSGFTTHSKHRGWHRWRHVATGCLQKLLVVAHSVPVLPGPLLMVLGSSQLPKGRCPGSPAWVRMENGQSLGVVPPKEGLAPASCCLVLGSGNAAGPSWPGHTVSVSWRNFSALRPC